MALRDRGSGWQVLDLLEGQNLPSGAGEVADCLSFEPVKEAATIDIDEERRESEEFLTMLFWLSSETRGAGCEGLVRPRRGVRLKDMACPSGATSGPEGQPGCCYSSDLPGKGRR